MQVRLLGPVDLWDGRRSVPIGPRARVVLATLALEAGRVVSVGRLIDTVWTDHPPTTATAQIQACVSSLRRALVVSDGPAARDVIVTTPPGYLLQVDEHGLDVLEFDELLARARAAAAAGRAKEAAAQLREALALWRGPALGGFDGLAAEATRLEERRLAALEERIDADLTLGAHADLISELTALVAAHPLRERFRGQLMLALHRAERRSEALEVYQETRRTLLEELGLEPGAELRRVQQAILAGDAELPGPEPAVAAGPSPLPPDVADFTGRHKQVAQVIDSIAGLPEPHAAVPVVTVTGRAGVGKTTLAVHVAHRLRSHHSGGQLYVNLHGTDAVPSDPVDVLGRLLRRLGLEGGAIPDDPEERGELYRARLDGRRVLVVLDNAADESQVRPLLPGSSTCAVIVTGRRHLTGLPGAVRVELDAFEPAQATELLGQVVGAERVAAEPAAGERIALLCDRLPLALRIAAARLAAKPHWTLDRMARRLADEHRRLDELTHADLEVRGSISLSHQSLSPAARRAFRLLSLLATPDFAGWTAAALLDVAVPSGEDLVEELIDARLLEVAGLDETGQTRYRFHDLLRVYAGERAAAEEPETEQRAALRRALATWLALAERAEQQLANPYYSPLYGTAPRRSLDELVTAALLGDPLDWFEAERAAIVAAVRQARTLGMPDLCWELAAAAHPYFEARGHVVDWRKCAEEAMAAARDSGDARGEAATLISMAGLNLVLTRFADAGRCLARAAAICADIGADYGRAAAVCGVASARRLAGDPEGARPGWRDGLELFRRSGDLRAQAYATEGIGLCDLDQGRPVQARAHFEEMLRLHQQADNRMGEAHALRRLATVELEMGRYDDALELLKRALPTFRAIGDRLSAAAVQMRMGEILFRQGHHAEARALLDHSMITFQAVGERSCEGHVLRVLGELLLADGDAAGAVERLRESMWIFRELAARLDLAETLRGLADAAAATGDAESAQAARAEARTLLDELGRTT